MWWQAKQARAGGNHTRITNDDCESCMRLCSKMELHRDRSAHALSARPLIYSNFYLICSTFNTTAKIASTVYVHVVVRIHIDRVERPSPRRHPYGTSAAATARACVPASALVVALVVPTGSCRRCRHRVLRAFPHTSIDPAIRIGPSTAVVVITRLRRWGWRVVLALGRALIIRPLFMEDAAAFRALLVVMLVVVRVVRPVHAPSALQSQLQSPCLCTALHQVLLVLRARLNAPPPPRSCRHRGGGRGMSRVGVHVIITISLHRSSFIVGIVAVICATVVVGRQTVKSWSLTASLSLTLLRLPVSIQCIHTIMGADRDRYRARTAAALQDGR